MLAKVCSAAVNGIEAYPVEVEVNAGFGDTLIVILSGNLPRPWTRRTAPSEVACILNGTRT